MTKLKLGKNIGNQNNMSEDELLSEIFGQTWTAKSGKKYVVHWCELCDCAIISCKECTGTTCNSHSCDVCSSDQDEFNEYTVNVEKYLNDEEIKIYQKCLRIKRHILNTIPKNIKKIDWTELQKQGNLSAWEKEMFRDENN